MVDKKIKVELDDEMNLEDLILLGEDKLFNIHIEYPKEDENGEFIIVKSKAKIKQFTLKEIRNINLKNITLDTEIKILRKSLYTQQDTPFTEELILNLPLGVVNAISREVMRISGVDESDIKKY